MRKTEESECNQEVLVVVSISLIGKKLLNPNERLEEGNDVSTVSTWRKNVPERENQVQRIQDEKLSGMFQRQQGDSCG